MKRTATLLATALLLISPAASAAPKGAILLKPARIFDGVDRRPHEGW